VDLILGPRRRAFLKDRVLFRLPKSTFSEYAKGVRPSGAWRRDCFTASEKQVKRHQFKALGVCRTGGFFYEFGVA
jgi:hypothetical protein